MNTPDHIETFTPRDDPAADLSRMVRIILDEMGPMPFNMLLGEVRARLSIEGATLHDTLNNLLAAGIIRIAPTGFYYGPAPF